MSEPEIDRDDPDAESMFDFLANNGRRSRRLGEAGERPLPIIRKPVPVSESGPLLPPEPGAPVEPPPALTDGNRKEEDDFSFLDDPPVRRPVAVNPGDLLVADKDAGSSGQDATPVLPAGRTAAHLTRVVANESPSRADSIQSSAAAIPVQRTDGKTAIDSEATRIQPPRVPESVTDPVIEFDDVDLDPDDTLDFDQLWNAGLEPVQLPEQPSRSNRGRWLALGLILLIIGLGAVSLQFFDFPATPLQNDAGGVNSSSESERTQAQAPSGAGLDAPENAISTVSGYTASPLMQRFRDELGRIEALVTEGRLDEASNALATMDRIVYGYGAMEFSALEDRIGQLRSRDTAAADANERAAREREAQAAAERAAREREAQAAAERAAREREAQAAAEQAARAEALRQERDRLSAQENANDVPAAAGRTTDADKLATDRQIAEERAAAQRRQARERRLVEARQREAAQAQSTTVPSTGAPSVPATEPASNSGPISDEDLQTVYRQFIALQEAIRTRDINAVVTLTRRSGVRVQQFLQMFENSSDIDVRIRDVSTRNATGEIRGTLQIISIRREDGSIVEPSKALSSIPLSSQREGRGWSAIAW
ncbi:MAG: hypothetical protein HKN42_06635 [Granulosicoccus sp.]|nr:hypothetical protein [Granulosicoccus sp.]